ncbi:hypothetical protein NW755_001135 [Fusarium falciforme]|uniref:Zn(2)-C6 fungal-type domain-containing protein n=1 Tax=Fusarium falciforme TaxID=195108 RepID=A0A9W8RKQ2_9HYPO|nr:hypothetical protein NW755_001135 [Fusarium falciforme]
MAENPSPDERVPIDELTPEEASRIIHSHRKVRYGTACWPCRQRKVKCDNKQPCENCVKREHPRLCSYKPNRSSTAKHSASAAPSEASVTNRKRTHSFSDSRPDESVRKVERQDSWPRTIGGRPQILNNLGSGHQLTETPQRALMSRSLRATAIWARTVFPPCCASSLHPSTRARASTSAKT